jgi:V8-like Glu-specific endopeptidase
MAMKSQGRIVAIAVSFLLTLPVFGGENKAQMQQTLRNLEKELDARIALKSLIDLGLQSDDIVLNQEFAGQKTEKLIKAYRDTTAQVTGPDNRTDVKFESSFPAMINPTLDGIPVTPELETNIAAVAAIVTEADLTRNANDVVLKTRKYTEQSNVCADVNFAQQPVAAQCTAFLVGTRFMATAGHCEDEIPAVNMRFVFGFRGEGTFRDRFSKDDVYDGVRYVSKTVAAPEDWAIIELDRDVVGRTPLVPDRSHPVQVNDAVYIIGHPEGLPLKIAGHAKVNAVLTNAFSTDLDALKGNSGSPVFLQSTHKVIGLLGIAINGYQSVGDCNVIQACAASRTDGCDGEGCTKISRLPEIKPLVPAASAVPAP